MDTAAGTGLVKFGWLCASLSVSVDAGIAPLSSLRCAAIFSGPRPLQVQCTLPIGQVLLAGYIVVYNFDVNAIMRLFKLFHV